LGVIEAGLFFPRKREYSERTKNPQFADSSALAKPPPLSSSGTLDTLAIRGALATLRLHFAEARQSVAAVLTNQLDSWEVDMTQGSISQLVTTHGSRWGRIQPEGESREIFFNERALDGGSDFLALAVGGAVEFEERADFVSGSHAEQVHPVPALTKKTS
jgi:cold shock CspA family protein